MANPRCEAYPHPHPPPTHPTLSLNVSQHTHTHARADSPGLVDGDMNYPFDVSSSIVWLADYVDIIMCFFDPIGQALCKRTVDVIRRLNETGHAEKMQYYMSKADQVDTELDRYAPRPSSPVRKLPDFCEVSRLRRGGENVPSTPAQEGKAREVLLRRGRTTAPAFSQGFPPTL